VPAEILALAAGTQKKRKPEEEPAKHTTYSNTGLQLAINSFL